jgi:hypothetical protein
MHVVTGPASILGLPGAICGSPHSLTASILDGSEVEFLPKENLLDLTLNDSAAFFKLLQIPLGPHTRRLRFVRTVDNF